MQRTTNWLCASLVAALVTTALAIPRGDEKPQAAPPPIDSVAHENEWRPVWELTREERLARDPRGHAARADVLVLPTPYPIDPTNWPTWFPARAPSPRVAQAGEPLTFGGRAIPGWRVVAHRPEHDEYLAERTRRYAEKDSKGLVAWLAKRKLTACLLFETRQMMGGRDTALRRAHFAAWKKQAKTVRSPVSFDLPVEGEWVSTPAAHHRKQAHSYFAVDLNRLVGGRSSRADGTRNVHFHSWGQPVLAQGDGIVSEAVDGNPDNAPGRMNARLPVNKVTIDYGGVSVVYAHLQKGSVSVEVGAGVTAGQVIGKVGNSGMSTAPHLHLEVRDASGHSMRPRFTIEARPERSRRWKRIDGGDLREGHVGRNLPRYERVPPDRR